MRLSTLCALALLCCASPLMGCGEMTTLETEFKPSLPRFRTEVQPTLNAQTCGRAPDEEKGVVGCHTPEQGGLKLVHKPTPEQEVENYRAAVALINVQLPSTSLLLLAPLNGPMPGGDEPDAGVDTADAGGVDSGSADAGQPAARPSNLAVDHPDYAGRFTTSDDCCYCSILLWICSGGPGTDPACAACEKYKGCDSCKPIIECAVGGAPEKAADNAAAFAEVTEIIAKGCGMCHGRPPALNTAEDMRTLVTGGEYLEPCATGGKLLRYIDGNNNDGLHGTLDAAQRGKIHVWVEELGAPTNSACVPGGTGDPSEAELFAQVVTALTGSCAGCHGVAPKLATEADVRALTAPVLVGCDATSTLLTFVDGNNGDSTHNISPLPEEQRALVHRWVEQAGAAMP